MPQDERGPPEVCEERSFHGVDYIVTVSIHGGAGVQQDLPSLHVDVEQKEDGERWHGEFSSAYVEEVTQKTGNFKKFDTFVKMLKSSLIQASETVFADLLTPPPPPMLRSRQARKAVPTATKANNKRYLILTYAVEFDRVHYPLPLAHVDQPSAHELRDTILRLRAEIKRLSPSSSSAAAAVKGGGPAGEEGEVEELRAAARQLRRERDEAVREGERQRGECAKLARANERLASDMARLEEAHGAGEREREGRWLRDARVRAHGAGEREREGRSLRDARRRVAEVENDLANEREEARQEQAELRHQLVALQKQVDSGQQAILDLRGRVRDAGQDADVARRRAKLSSDPRLDSKRAIYGQNPGGSGYGQNPVGASRPVSAPSSRPASAERRRPTPPPARPFQRFDPTAYVKSKAATRAVSPRPGTAPPQRPTPTHSAPSSRNSSVERQRAPWGSSAASSRPTSAPRPYGEHRRTAPAAPPTSSASSSRPASAERARPGPWAARRPPASSVRPARP
ncbi:hypothetical protein T484DRAFT_1905047 [Baffinella frigidus]|nr:hypothetical protein T484DRAFT_1905047 [Cryptophyta sp. CCMP2293]